uniref:Uncharacterized protein n=1 Tax=Ditylenchus dipsaci TaxID=166011 RepID=A0A915D011_9BILA
MEKVRRIIEVNVMGTLNVTMEALDLMIHNEKDEDGQRGVIINTSSIAAYEGQVGQFAYAASKGAIASMTLPLARDMADSGSMSPKAYQYMSTAVPNPSRMGTPGEFGALVCSHCSESLLLMDLLFAWTELGVCLLKIRDDYKLLVKFTSLMTDIMGRVNCELPPMRSSNEEPSGTGSSGAQNCHIANGMQSTKADREEDTYLNDHEAKSSPKQSKSPRCEAFVMTGDKMLNLNPKISRAMQR